MSSIKILVLPIFIVIAVLIIWVFIKPLYEETRGLDKVKRVEMESLVQQENDLQQRADKLFEESANGDQGVLVMRALPQDQNSKELVAQIENIIKKEKMTITSLSVDDNSTAAELGAGILGKTGDVHQTISGKVEVKGSYGQFKQLLRDIRKLERVVNITQLDIKNASEDESEGFLGRYGISFDAYWQEETTAEQVKAGLESREFAPTSGELLPGNSAIPGAPAPGLIQ